MMLEIKPILFLLSCIVVVECKMEPFVVGGEIADITKFPHSVFLSVICDRDYTTKLGYFHCGGSIINEMLVLTAAHCVYGCSYKSQFAITVGHNNYNKGEKRRLLSYLIHECFNTRNLANDIAIMKVKGKLQFSKKVQRVALMRNPPSYSKAQIAGWGWTNEYNKTDGELLKSLDQNVWENEACRRVLTFKPPKGTICASSEDLESYSSGGDSGSALVIQGYIQVGLVSYKEAFTNRSLVVYTDTGYFYNWITKNGKKLYCLTILKQPCVL